MNRFIKFGIGFSVADTMERYLAVPGIDPTVGEGMLCGNKGILRLFGSESPGLLWACIIRKKSRKYGGRAAVRDEDPGRYRLRFPAFSFTGPDPCCGGFPGEKSSADRTGSYMIGKERYRYD